MKLTKLQVANFRSIKGAEVFLDDLTVIIGPNNSGKSAFMEALRIALTRRWGMKGSGFLEYDVHLPNETSDPKTEPPVSIQIEAAEMAPGEWPDELVQDLTNVLYLDPVSGKQSINLRVSCAWSAAEGKFVPTWHWLNTSRQPLTGAAAKQTNLDAFWRYLPVFYLGALRDPSDEFSSRSQFWGRLLKAVEVPAELEKRVLRVLSVVNNKLLSADPMLRDIADTLGHMTSVASASGTGGADIRLLPLKPWDILSEAEVIARNEAASPWLPLSHHGQGLQSLSVLFLFGAFVRHLLAELYETQSTAVLLLEEPEAHLHPQAARALWERIQALPGQKIVTSHSPYFVQRVPFRSLRLVRLEGSGTTVHWLRDRFTATLPPNPTVQAVVAKYPALLEFDNSSSTLTVRGALPEAQYRELLTCYAGHAQLAQATDALLRLKTDSALYVTDDDLRSLETFAKRIRGEIFFAKKWVFLEGQSEYLLFEALCQASGLSLDTMGISIIDAKNNGDPAIFSALARALAFPWVGVFDRDPAGDSYIARIRDRGFAPAEVALRCKQFAVGALEAELLANGLEAELRGILVDLGDASAAGVAVPELTKKLEKAKTKYASALGQRVLDDATIAARMPVAFRDVVAMLPTLS